MIHTDLQVPAVEHNYNLQQRRNPHPDYTNIYGFQVTIIYCALTQLSVKRGLKKFKQKAKILNCRTRTASQEGCISASEDRETFRIT